MSVRLQEVEGMILCFCSKMTVAMSQWDLDPETKTRLSGYVDPTLKNWRGT